MYLSVVKATGLLLLSAVFAGCGSNMTLGETSIPTPLVQPIPLHVGLKIDPNMYKFSREEEILGSENWSVDMGDENASLFVNLFGHMFSEVTVVGEGEDASALPIDALVETSIDAFEFSVPKQTGTESFAIWIRYRLKVFNRDGEMIANWPVSAYGKSESKALAASQSLENAAVLAMRDAAALMIMKFDEETGISSLIPPSSSSEATAAVPAAGPTLLAPGGT